jgi:hypothetical protein
MRKAKSKPSQCPDPDADTMRPEYDFSGGARGVTAARYGKGTSIVVLDPDVAAVFPTSQAVNEALRTLTRVLRPAMKGVGKRGRRPARGHSG